MMTALSRNDLSLLSEMLRVQASLVDDSQSDRLREALRRRARALSRIAAGQDASEAA